VPKPNPQDNRTKVQKLLELAQREEGTPEGDNALARARQLFEKGERLLPFPIGARINVDGRPAILRGERWPKDAPKPNIQVDWIQPQPMFQRVVFVQSFYEGSSTTSTTTATNSGFWTFHRR
jgi:hypothetical protein